MEINYSITTEQKLLVRDMQVSALVAEKSINEFIAEINKVMAQKQGELKTKNDNVMMALQSIAKEKGFDINEVGFNFDTMVFIPKPVDTAVAEPVPAVVVNDVPAVVTEVVTDPANPDFVTEVKIAA